MSSEDVTVGGYTVPAGWVISADPRISNNSPDVFPEPEKVRVLTNLPVTPTVLNGWGALELDTDVCSPKEIDERVELSSDKAAW
eukprot:1180462-Prorocentrum_minimum.AAC.6